MPEAVPIRTASSSAIQSGRSSSTPTSMISITRHRKSRTNWRGQVSAREYCRDGRATYSRSSDGSQTEWVGSFRQRWTTSGRSFRQPDTAVRRPNPALTEATMKWPLGFGRHPDHDRSCRQFRGFGCSSYDAIRVDHIASSEILHTDAKGHIFRKSISRTIRRHDRPPHYRNPVRPHCSSEPATTTNESSTSM